MQTQKNHNTIALITRKFHPRGTQRILRLFFNPKKYHFKEVSKYDDDLLINIDSSSYSEWLIFFKGYYEKPVIDLIKSIVKNGFICFDIGANIGSHTLIMGKMAGETGKVLSFEPHPEIYKRLVSNINLNRLNNIEVFQTALSEKPGKTILHSFGEEIEDKGTSSLYEKTYSNLKNKFEINVSTIDEITNKKKIDRLDFIKIDARGSDFPAILGADKSIKKFKPYIVFEYNQENWECANRAWGEMEKFFKDNNYNLYLINKNNLCPITEKPKVLTSYNILAVPLNKPTQK